MCSFVKESEDKLIIFFLPNSNLSFQYSFFFEVGDYIERDFYLCILLPVVMQSKQHCVGWKTDYSEPGQGLTGLSYARVYLQV